jgi:hypothetical protein
MKNLKMSVLVIGVVGIFLGISGCAPSGGGGSGESSSGEPTIMEGVWVSNCQYESFLNVYTKDTGTYLGNTLTGEQFTYSDDQCTIRSSGADFRYESTFIVENGDILDGKQLTKFTITMKVLFSEGFVALFFPIGSTHTLISQEYIDGNKMYETDDTNNLSLTGSGYDYVAPTQINYDYYVVKQ